MTKPDHSKECSIPWAVVLLFFGAVFGAVSAFALSKDVHNNYAYFVETNADLAGVFAATAFVAFLIPAYAGVVGWTKSTASVTVLFVALACWCSANVYSSDLGKDIAGRGMAARDYADAQAEAEAARADAKAARYEASRITETASVDALRSLKDDAAKALKDTSAKADEDGIACLSSKRCREAFAALTSITSRLGAAETKVATLDRADKADAKVAKAKAEKGEAGKTAPATSSVLLKAIAGNGNVDAVVQANSIGTMAAGVIATQIMLLMSHLSTAAFSISLPRLFGSLFGRRKSRTAPSPRGGKQKLADAEQTAANVFSIQAARKARNKRAGTSASAQRSAHNAILKAQVADLLAKGHSVNEVAKLINVVGRSTIQRWAKEIGRPEVAKKAATV